MKQLCARDGVRLSRVLRADDINAVMALVQRGKGYALGPVSFAEYFGVAAVPLEPKMEVALYLLCRKEERGCAVSALPEGRAEFCPHPTPAETFEGRPVTASCGQLIHSLKNLRILFTRALQLSHKRGIMRSIHHSAGKEDIQ